MLDKELLESEIAKVLEKNAYHLYAMNIFKKEGELILSVEIDESLDLDHIALISEEISSMLDDIDTSEDRYILDVSSAGIERTISLDELDKALNSFIHVECDDAQVFEGDLIRNDDATITLKTKVKNLYKEEKISKAKIKKIRYAVKF